MEQKTLDNTLNTLTIIITLALFYVVAGKLSFDLLLGKTIVNIGLFASEGFALAFALQFGKKVFFGIFLGQLILTLTNSINLQTSLIIAAVNSTEALLGIYLFDKFKLQRDLNTFRDILGLLVIITLILQVYSATVSNAALLLNGYITSKEYLFSSFSWWFGNVMGQFLFTPFLLLLFKNYKTINYKNLILFSLISLLYMYILEVVVSIKSPLLLLSLTGPFIIYITSKKGTLYGISFAVVSSLMSSLSIHLQTGAFYAYTNFENIINYNLFALSHIIIALTAGALFYERKQNEINLKLIIEEEVEKNKQQQLLMLQQSRMAQMGEMIAMIAHQWRQPLNNLSLVSQLLVSKYKKGKLDDETVEYFKENSNKQIRQMSRTIDDFRNFFKSEKEKQEFSLNSIIINILNMVETTFTSNDIKINFYSQKEYRSLGYPNELGQAILNIINNAKDALIDKKIEDKQVNISLQENNKNIIISISDNADGIADEIIDKIFDPYFSTKEEKNGTGLGLYITKIIIEEHLNAKITVENNENGATFKIYLKQEL